MNFWLDLFTYQTWIEFINYGSKVTGFAENKKNVCNRINPGDILLCYLAGSSRWVGALEIVGKTTNIEKIYELSEFPIRFEVKPLVILDPDYSILLSEFIDKLEIYKNENKYTMSGFLLSCPNVFKNDKDGQHIMNALQERKKNPVFNPLTEKEKGYIPPKYIIDGKKVIIPDINEKEVQSDQASEENLHTKIQYMLLELGSKMGMSLWVASNDRSKSYQGRKFSDIPGMLEILPTGFDPATQKIVGLIDVLWLHNKSIEAAFEIESTTSIYSGLLRMSDLIAAQPKLDIDLYLVAPEERKRKVNIEILRPTFSCIDSAKPLPEICGYISFENFTNKLSELEKTGIDFRSLRPSFIKNYAEYFK